MVKLYTGLRNVTFDELERKIAANLGLPRERVCVLHPATGACYPTGYLNMWVEEDYLHYRIMDIHQCLQRYYNTMKELRAMAAKAKNEWQEIMLLMQSQRGETADAEARAQQAEQNREARLREGRDAAAASACHTHEAHHTANACRTVRPQPQRPTSSPELSPVEEREEGYAKEPVGKGDEEDEEVVFISESPPRDPFANIPAEKMVDLTNEDEDRSGSAESVDLTQEEDEEIDEQTQTLMDALAMTIHVMRHRDRMAREEGRSTPYPATEEPRFADRYPSPVYSDPEDDEGEAAAAPVPERNQPAKRKGEEDQKEPAKKRKKGDEDGKDDPHHKSLPIRISRLDSKPKTTAIHLARKSEEDQPTKPLPSETTRFQLAQVYMTVRNQEGNKEEIRVALDSQSNITYALPEVATERQWDRGEIKTVMGVGGYAGKESKPVWVTVMRKGKEVSLKARTPPEGVFDDGTKVLLSAAHCKMLRIDMNHAIYNLKHQRVRYTDERKRLRRAVKHRMLQAKRERGMTEPTPRDDWKWASKNTIKRILKHYNKKGYRKMSRAQMTKALEETSPEVKEEAARCLLSEKKVAAYMESKGGVIKESKKATIGDLDIPRDIPKDAVANLKQIFLAYSDVFSANPDNLPPTMKGIPEHKFQFKEGTKPTYCRRPHMGPQTRKFIDAWTTWALKQGLIEPAPKSAWASRIVLAPKFRGGTPKTAVPDDLRVCVDFTQVNEKIKKMVPTYPDPFEQMRRAAGYEWYFTGDGLKQFWSIPLHESSRDSTAIWTTQGLMRFTRLIMGTCNASTIAQNHYTNAMNKHITGNLPDGTPYLDRIFNFQDDFIIAAHSLEEMSELLEAFLRMCREAGVQMNPAKAHLRSGTRASKDKKGKEQKPGVQFYGYNISAKGISPAEKNLDPVSKMTAPKDVSGVRAVLGVFNQFRSFFPRFDQLVKPIQQLTRKNKKFEWGEKEQEAMEAIRAKLLTGKLYLEVQDPLTPLHLETDASDDGWGAILYQQTEKDRKIICMWSKQWSDMMKKMPAYYRETKAWMNGVQKAKVYADYNHHPLICWTDHIPLTYIKNTSGKGPVSQFHLDNLSYIDYEIRYRKGTEIAADHVSRFPMLGPQRMSAKGTRQALVTLLQALPKEFSPEGRTWLYAGKETMALRDILFKWQKQACENNNKSSKLRVAITDRPRPSKVKEMKYSFAVWTPPAEKVAEVMQAALTQEKPFACLVPSCLVHAMARTDEQREAMSRTIKIALLAPELTWVIAGVKGMQHTVKMAWGIKDYLGKAPNTAGLVGDMLQWDDHEFAQAQKGLANLYKKEHIFVRKDGFVIYKPDADTEKVIVPEKYRQELVMWQHKRMCHAGPAKVYAALAKTYHWPSMKSSVKRTVEACEECQTLKAKRKRTHQHFRAKPHHIPRTAYAMDYYGVGKSDEGYTNILGVIDLATSEIRLFPTKDRKANTTTQCLLNGVFLRNGCAVTLHSDHAKEFVSRSVQRICKITGCRPSTTLAHHPTGNATIERLWQFIGLVLRQMTDAQYRQWHKYIRLAEHTWNIMEHSVLGVSPFEAAHGLPARSAVDSLMETAPETTTSMEADDIQAMQQAAKIMCESIRQLRTHDKQTRADAANKTKQKQTFKLGDKVVFYIPPTQKEAQERGRKVKHLAYYRGPATITQVRTPTTYSLEHEGKKYARATAELRPYKGNASKKKKVAFDVPEKQQSEVQQPIGKGEWVLYRDDLESANYHLGKVQTTGENLEIATWATATKKLKNAIWKPLFQIEKTCQYTVGNTGNKRKARVMDIIPMEESAEYIGLRNVAMTKANKIALKTQREIKRKRLNHHQLGKTFP